MQSISFYSLLVLSIAGPAFIQSAPLTKLTDISNFDNLLGLGSLGGLDQSNLLGGNNKEVTNTIQELENEINNSDNLFSKRKLDLGQSKVTNEDNGNTTTKEVKERVKRVNDNGNSHGGRSEHHDGNDEEYNQEHHHHNSNNNNEQNDNDEYRQGHQQGESNYE